MEQTGATPETPANPGMHSAGSVQKQLPPIQVVGTCILQDMHGKEINLDGTPKVPYRHTNFSQVTALLPGQHDRPQRQPVVQDHAHIATKTGTMMNSRQKAPTQQLVYTRTGVPTVKPAKMNIPEFEGKDAESWIQTTELYFDSARTPLDQQTEVAVTYLKGDAIQWWRGTGYSASNLPWHRFCRYVRDRFAETSICDNVRAFHSLTQTSTVAIYV
jgi:hypothetical protein